MDTDTRIALMAVVILLIAGAVSSAMEPPPTAAPAEPVRPAASSHSLNPSLSQY